MENKEDVKYVTVGSILEYLWNGIKTGKFTTETLVLGKEDEFFFIHRIEEPAFHQLQDKEMNDEIEDYIYNLDCRIKSYEAELDDADATDLDQASKDFIAFNKAQLKDAEEEKAEFESWIKQNAIVFN